MKRFASALFGICACSQAFGIGVFADAKVVAIRIDSDGRGMVFFDKAATGTPPGCAIDAYAKALAFGGNDNGRAIMSWALTAKATGSIVTVYGLGVCSIFGPTNVEDWNYGVMN